MEKSAERAEPRATKGAVAISNTSAPPSIITLISRSCVVVSRIDGGAAERTGICIESKNRTVARCTKRPCCENRWGPPPPPGGVTPPPPPPAGSIKLGRRPAVKVIKWAWSHCVLYSWFWLLWLCSRSCHQAQAVFLFFRGLRWCVLPGFTGFLLGRLD